VPQLIWDMTDLLLALMAFLNIAALVALRRTVCETARI
jgi:Na+/alanine symporter